MNIVKERKIRQGRLNYVEKSDKDSAPMESVLHINVLEQTFFDHIVKTSGKFKAIKNSIHSSLHNQLIFCVSHVVNFATRVCSKQNSIIYAILLLPKKKAHILS